jgi:hypothetical protein
MGKPTDLVQGTLHLLILKTLALHLESDLWGGLDSMGEKQNPPFPVSITTSLRGRRSRGRIARSDTGRSEAAPVIEVYDALAEVYADHYEPRNPDQPFLKGFSPISEGVRDLLDVGCGTGSGAKVFLLTACV